MKIVDIEKHTVFFVTTDRGVCNLYIRYAANNWATRMGGCSTPVIYNCKDLEKAFQKKMKKFI